MSDDALGPFSSLVLGPLVLSYFTTAEGKEEGGIYRLTVPRTLLGSDLPSSNRTSNTVKAPPPSTNEFVTTTGVVFNEVGPPYSIVAFTFTISVMGDS